MNRTELLNDMRTGRAQFDEALSGLSYTQMTELPLDNGWTLKDLLAHMYIWAHYMADAYQMLLRGETPDLKIPLDEAALNEFNARTLEEQRKRSFGDLLRDETRAYRALLAIAETAPEDHLFQPGYFAWTGSETFAEWIIGNTSGHYREHWAQITDWLKTVERQAEG